jgi:hypothetical protein
MQGARDIASERGWFVLAVLVAATVLVAIGKLTGSDWKTLVMVLGGLLAHQAALSAPVPEATP